MSTLFIFRILVGQLTVAVVVIYWHFVAVIFSELFCCWSSVENCDRKTKQQLKLVAFVLKSIPISRVACSESDYWIFHGVVFSWVSWSAKTQQRFYLDLRSLMNTNRKSYFLSRLVPSACCFVF